MVTELARAYLGWSDEGGQGSDFAQDSAGRVSERGVFSRLGTVLGQMSLVRIFNGLSGELERMALE